MKEMTYSSEDERPGGIPVYYVIKEIKSFSLAFWIPCIFIRIGIDRIDHRESLSAVILTGELFWARSIYFKINNQH